MNWWRTYLIDRGFTFADVMAMTLGDCFELIALDRSFERPTGDADGR